MSTSLRRCVIDSRFSQRGGKSLLGVYPGDAVLVEAAVELKCRDRGAGAWAVETVGRAGVIAEGGERELDARERLEVDALRSSASVGGFTIDSGGRSVLVERDRPGCFRTVVLQEPVVQI